MKNSLLGDLAELLKPIALVAAVAGALGVGFLQSNTYFELQRQAVRNTALTECAQVSKVTYESYDEETGRLLTKSEVTAQEYYRSCVEDKGYQLK